MATLELNIGGTSYDLIGGVLKLRYNPIPPPAWAEMIRQLDNDQQLILDLAAPSSGAWQATARALLADLRHARRRREQKAALPVYLTMQPDNSLYEVLVPLTGGYLQPLAERGRDYFTDDGIRVFSLVLTRADLPYMRIPLLDHGYLPGPDHYTHDFNLLPFTAISSTTPNLKNPPVATHNLTNDGDADAIILQMRLTPSAATETTEIRHIYAGIKRLTYESDPASSDWDPKWHVASGSQVIGDPYGWTVSGTGDNEYVGQTVDHNGGVWGRCWKLRHSEAHAGADIRHFFGRYHAFLRASINDAEADILKMRLGYGRTGYSDPDDPKNNLVYTPPLYITCPTGGTAHCVKLGIVDLEFSEEGDWIQSQIANDITFQLEAYTEDASATVNLASYQLILIPADHYIELGDLQFYYWTSPSGQAKIQILTDIYGRTFVSHLRPSASGFVEIPASIDAIHNWRVPPGGGILAYIPAYGSDTAYEDGQIFLATAQHNLGVQVIESITHPL